MLVPLIKHVADLQKVAFSIPGLLILTLGLPPLSAVGTKHCCSTHYQDKEAWSHHLPASLQWSLLDFKFICINCIHCKHPCFKTHFWFRKMEQLQPKKCHKKAQALEVDLKSKSSTFQWARDTKNTPTLHLLQGVDSRGNREITIAMRATPNTCIIFSLWPLGASHGWSR